MEKYHKRIFLSIMAFAFLIATFLGLSYAYFIGQGNASVNKNVSVTSNTTDLLTFQISNDISFRVTQADFGANGLNKSGESTATAVLIPNNNTNEATMHYYVYLKMDSNPIVFSSTNTNHDPELMLQVFDSNNQLVTLTGLGTQKTIKGVTGYDITGRYGLITIFDNRAITANGSTTTENWTIKITMINLDVDQNDNTNKTVTGEVILRKTEIPYCELNPNELGCQIDLTYNPETSNTIELTGTGESGYLYHHDNTLTNGASDGGYRYAGANPNNYVCFGSAATTCPDANLYRIIGLIPVDVVTDATTTPVTTEQQMLYKIIKNDYLTSTEVPTGTGTYNQYSHPSTYNGPSGNQYVSDPQGYYWSGSYNNTSNTWSGSTLNTDGLNGDYLTSLGSTWTNKIATVMWKVGGGDGSYIISATPMSTVYTNEITNSGQNVANATTDGKNELPAKVGLMYVSDYGYAAPSSAWSTDLYSYSSVVANNWLYRGIHEWTVSRYTDKTTRAYSVDSSGRVVNHYVYSRDVYSGSLGVRPTFYLTEDTVIDMSNHNGTISDPYRIIQ